VKPAQIVSVDIDNTIFKKIADYSKSKLRPGAQKALRKIRKAGYVVVLYTGRHFLQAEVTERRLKKLRIPYDHIVYGKPPACFYIDNDAGSFQDFFRRAGL
jgi:hypothetical protein